MLVLLACVLAYMFWQNENDHVSFGVKLDNYINGVLHEAGVTDNDIISQSREEFSGSPGRWIETRKVVVLPGGCDFEDIKRRIEYGTQQLGAEVYRREKSGENYVFEIGRKKKVLLRLIFRQEEKESGLEGIRKYIALGVPVTLAVMPYQRYSAEAAKLLNDAGYSYFLHLPMEPVGYPSVNPGHGALFASMSDARIREGLGQALESVSPGGISPDGINNHMGSRFTADRKRMEVLLREIDKRGMFFIDSYTSTKSECRKAAEAAGMEYTRNNIFLDTVDDPVSIEKKFRELIRIGKKKGKAVAIGHITKKHTYSVFARMLAEFRKNGCELVFAKDL